MEECFFKTTLDTNLNHKYFLIEFSFNFLKYAVAIIISVLACILTFIIEGEINVIIEKITVEAGCVGRLLIPEL